MLILKKLKLFKLKSARGMIFIFALLVSIVNLGCVSISSSLSVQIFTLRNVQLKLINVINEKPWEIEEKIKFLLQKNIGDRNRNKQKIQEPPTFYVRSLRCNQAPILTLQAHVNWVVLIKAVLAQIIGKPKIIKSDFKLNLSSCRYRTRSKYSQREI